MSKKSTTSSGVALPDSVINNGAKDAPVRKVAPRYDNPRFAIHLLGERQGDYVHCEKMDGATWRAMGNWKRDDGKRRPALEWDDERTENGAKARVFKFVVNGKNVDIVRLGVRDESSGYENDKFFILASEAPKFMGTDKRLKL